jgi:hypothetical protein
VPGTIQAEDFDNGGEGVAYHDSGPNNAGGAYRQTGVDIEAASSGGYDVGWFAPGDWMNYTISVPSAGTYTVALRVASSGGGSLHVGFNSASNVWQPVSVSNTGGWQAWTTVSFAANARRGHAADDADGRRRRRQHRFDHHLVRWLRAFRARTRAAAPPPPTTNTGGTPLNVVE